MNATSKFGRRYPWAEWFAQGRFFLRRGDGPGFDYSCRSASMCQMIYQAAYRRGLRVAISTAQDENSLDVTVIDGEVASGEP
jgi:hypothetical protein